MPVTPSPHPRRHGRRCVGFVAWRYPRAAPESVADTGGRRAHGRRDGREASRGCAPCASARLDPAAATGLALTLALVVVIGGGLLLGVLAYLVRSNGHLIGIDNGVAKWGNQHASAASTHVLNAITQLGGIYAIIVLLRRARRRRDDPGAKRAGSSRSSSR